MCQHACPNGHRGKQKLFPADASGHNRIAYNNAMAISPHWYRENANACAWRAEQSRDPLAKAAYKEMVRAWLILAVSAEELVRYPPRKARTEDQALAA
jgi:hypothetical protein